MLTRKFEITDEGEVDEYEGGTIRQWKLQTVKNISRDGRHGQGNCQVKYRIHYNLCRMSIYMGIEISAKTSPSTMEAEFITLSEGLCRAIPIINLIEELREKRIGMPGEGAKVRCKVFEDNLGARFIAAVLRIRPRTVDITLCTALHGTCLTRDKHSLCQIRGSAG